MPETDWSAIKKGYEAGTSLRKLAEQHGISKSAIDKRAKAAGWTVDKKRVDKKKVSTRVSTKVSTEKQGGIDWQEIRAEYLSTNCSTRDLAKKYGVSASTILKRCSREGWKDERDQIGIKVESEFQEKLVEQRVDDLVQSRRITQTYMDWLEAYLNERLMLGMEMMPKSIDMLNVSNALRNGIAAVKESKSMMTPTEELNLEKFKREVAAAEKAENEESEGIRFIVEAPPGIVIDE